MSNRQITVQKNRTNIVTVSLGFNVSDDTFRSQIRANKDQTSPLLAEWNVSFVTDGKDGDLRLVLEPDATKEVKNTFGFMDVLRVTGSDALSVFDEPIRVVFIETVTATADV